MGDICQNIDRGWAVFGSNELAAAENSLLE